MPSVASMTIEVILPCLNEAAALPWVLDRLPVGYQALVVDNGSTDGSAEIARSAQGADHPRRTARLRRRMSRRAGRGDRGAGCDHGLRWEPGSC